MIYSSQQPLSYPKDATLTDLLLHHNINNTPDDKPAIIDGISGETHVVRVKPGDVVGILSTNRVSQCPQNYYPVCVHGILATGAVVSALNPLYEPGELSHALKLSRPSHILVEKDLSPRLAAAVAMTPGVDPVLHLWDSTRDEGQAKALDIESILRSGSADFEPAKLPPGATARTLAFICFSSGTSGLVKGVKLSHGNVVANIFQQSQGLAGMFNPKTVTALIVPFFHILGLAGFSCQYVCQGAPIVVFKRFELPLLLKAVKRDKITHINVVPPIALEFLRNPVASEGDYSSVQCLVNAAAPLDQRQADELSKKIGCVVTSWYGMTEASPSVASQREEETNIRGTIGRLLPGMEMRVVDEEGKDASVGEFIIRGPNIMQGYVAGAEKVDSPMTADGFMKTGDIGYVNDDGYLFIVDRAKEMIKVKGQQVAPAELEAILITHPLVNDAAVCGVYNEHGTSEVPVAYITTSVEGSDKVEALKREVLEHVNARVARYKQIKGGIFVLPSIPRNPAGKILRRLLPANVARRKPIAKL
ncbi:4-coumarate-CoA ligase [Plectosphaerella cucumerina]|uniref:4-coumarate-CoA ligase n=1 Tax=Plectosphaerella cucumerina TaxID=40658 RepID=A0A8K0TK85_9PEZI|nr:4-coumarate-CoA ligase [Plectosphaerella cucumerina]